MLAVLIYDEIILNEKNNFLATWSGLRDPSSLTKGPGQALDSESVES